MSDQIDQTKIKQEPIRQPGLPADTRFGGYTGCVTQMCQKAAPESDTIAPKNIACMLQTICVKEQGLIHGEEKNNNMAEQQKV